MSVVVVVVVNLSMVSAALGGTNMMAIARPSELVEMRRRDRCSDAGIRGSEECLVTDMVTWYVLGWHPCDASMCAAYSTLDRHSS